MEKRISIKKKLVLEVLEQAKSDVLKEGGITGKTCDLTQLGCHNCPMLEMYTCFGSSNKSVKDFERLISKVNEMPASGFRYLDKLQDTLSKE